MKTLLLAVMASAAGWAQASPPPAAPQAPPAQVSPPQTAAPAEAPVRPPGVPQTLEETVGDVERFPQLRQSMEQAQNEFLRLNHEVIDVEIPQLLKRDPCHPRIAPEVNRVVAAMATFHRFETAYWQKVAEANLEQIQSLEAIAALQQESVKSLNDKLKIEEEERAEAEARLKEVQKAGEEAAGVAAEGETLLARIQATQERLKGTMAEAARAQRSLTEQTDAIYFRKQLVEAGMRGLEARHSDLNQFFVSKRAEYAARCRPAVPNEDATRGTAPQKKQE